MRARSRLVACSVLGSAALLAATAVAQPRPRPTPNRNPVGVQNAGPQRRLTLQEATQRLHSANPDEVSEGLDALTLLGTPQVIPPLVELIHSGVSDGVLDTVVEKFGLIGRPEAIDELESLLHHRRPSVRQRAVTALSRITDNRVRGLIESALRDSNGDVRSEAAQALGRINARASVVLLQRAFERNVPSAAESIGALGDMAAADRLLDAVGHAPLSVLLPGFRRFLDRRDFTDPQKVRIIEQLVSRSPTQQVKGFLQDWVQSLPPANASLARRRADLAIRQINATPAATPPAVPTPTPSAAPAGGAQ